MAKEDNSGEQSPTEGDNSNNNEQQSTSLSNLSEQLTVNLLQSGVNKEIIPGNTKLLYANKIAETFGDLSGTIYTNLITEVKKINEAIDNLSSIYIKGVNNTYLDSQLSADKKNGNIRIDFSQITTNKDNIENLTKLVIAANESLQKTTGTLQQDTSSDNT